MLKLFRQRLPVGLVSKEEHEGHRPAKNEHQIHDADEGPVSRPHVAVRPENDRDDESDGDTEHSHYAADSDDSMNSGLVVLQSGNVCVGRVHVVWFVESGAVEFVLAGQVVFGVIMRLLAGNLGMNVWI